jgi:hypothetical protein
MQEFRIRIAAVASRALNYSSRFESRLAGVVLLSAFIVGCGRGAPAVPDDDAAENIGQLALAYLDYASTHKGVGPADQAELAKALEANAGISADEARGRLTSPRDDKPYVIRWKQRPMAPALGHDPPKANLLIYEQDGSGGTRYTADGQLAIKEMSDEDIRATYPEFESAAD